MTNKLPVVITEVDSQHAQVRRLVDYIYDLDGTRVKIIPAPGNLFHPNDAGNDRANKQARTFHIAAAAMKGKAFIWIEVDSIPRFPNWAQALTDEWRKSGKPFLLPDLTGLHPNDHASGIGVYPAETSWLIPKEFPSHPGHINQGCGWDRWVYENLRDIIHFTPLIQHSYGAYSSPAAEATCIPHVFPRDEKILRPDAVLFHRDQTQSLIPPFQSKIENLTKSVESIEISPQSIDRQSPDVPSKSSDPAAMRHSGDIGDVIAALPILRVRGGGKIILFRDDHAPKGMCARESLKGARYEALKPLLEAQPYVTAVEWSDTIKIDKESGFRETLRPMHESLIERQARHVGVWPLDTSPWLTVPNVEKHNRIICARSSRYHNSNFPWRDVGQTYRDQLLFVGLPDEHRALEAVMGRRIEPAKTENLLDVAKLIAGSPQFIGNQSAPLWIALGLGIQVVVEGLPAVPNSDLGRQNAFYVYETGSMHTLRAALARIYARRPQ